MYLEVSNNCPDSVWVSYGTRLKESQLLSSFHSQSISLKKFVIVSAFLQQLKHAISKVYQPTYSAHSTQASYTEYIHWKDSNCVWCNIQDGFNETRNLYSRAGHPFYLRHNIRSLWAKLSPYITPPCMLFICYWGVRSYCTQAVSKPFHLKADIFTVNFDHLSIVYTLRFPIKGSLVH